METKLYQLLFIVMPILFLSQNAHASFFMGDSNTCNPTHRTALNSMFEGVIIGFVLVDADTNKDLTALTDGMEVQADAIQGRNLNIRLQLDDGAVRVLQVDFKLSGPMVIEHSEKVIPHALLGDISGNYNGMPFPSGSYTLWAGANDSTTPHYWDELEIHFEIGNFENKLFDFRLIRSEVDFVFGPVKSQYQFNSNAPETISMQATPKTYKIGSVAFELQGPLSYVRIENVAPYTLFGDFEGDYYGKILPIGFYTLTATPYSLPNKQGDKGESLTIQFSVEDLLSLDLSSSAILVDATTDEALVSMGEYENNTIDNSKIATDNVNIFLSPLFTTNIKSVSLSLDGGVTHQSIENVEPYALFGDTAGDFNGMQLPLGKYFLKATPYAQTNGQGKPGFSRFFEFEIINSVQEATITLKATNALPRIYPNPANGQINIGSVENTTPRTITILDFSGKEIKRFSQTNDSKTSVDISDLSKGLYMVRIDNGKTSTVQKLIME